MNRRPMSPPPRPARTATRTKAASVATAMSAGLVALAALAAAPPARAQAAPAAPCRVVLGGGSHAAAGELASKDLWNRINFSFYDAGQYALSQTGRDAKGFFVLVEAADPGAALARAVAAAREAGCDELVRLGVYADDSRDPPEMVFRIAVFDLPRDGGATPAPAPAHAASAGASAPALGAARYAREYRYPIDPDVDRQVQPARLGARAVADYLDAPR